MCASPDMVSYKCTVTIFIYETTASTLLYDLTHMTLKDLNCQYKYVVHIKVHIIVYLSDLISQTNIMQHNQFYDH